MPRSQRTNLVKTAVNETSLGEFKSKVGGAVAMPFVQPQKSAGQALAEGVGIAATAVATVGQAKADESNKRIAVEQRNKGLLHGRQAANDFVSEAQDLLRAGDITLDKVEGKQSVNEWFAIKMGSYNEILGKTDNVNTSFLSGAFQSMGNILSSEQGKNEKLIAAKKLEVKVEETRAGILADMASGKPGADIYTMSKTTDALSMTNDEYAKMYVSTVAAFIKQQKQTDPNYDDQTAITNFLKITTNKEQGSINFANHPTYGKTIDTLESSLATLKTARETATTKANDKFGDDLTKKAITVASNTDSTPVELADARENIVANINSMAVGDYQTSLDVIDAALSAEGFLPVSKSETSIWVNNRLNAGTLTAADLKIASPSLSQKEFLASHKAMGAYKESLQKGNNQALAGYATQQLTNLKRQVATVNEFGAFAEDNGPDKVNAANQQWSEYLISYRAENPENPFPSVSDQSKKASEIKASVNKQFAPEVPLSEIVTEGDVSKYSQEVAEATRAELLIINKVEKVLSATEPTKALISGDISEEEYKAFKEAETKQKLWQKSEDETILDRITNLFN